MTSVPIDVPINDDNIMEGNEDFNLTIIHITLPDGVTRNKPGRSTVIIVDNDCKLRVNNFLHSKINFKKIH